MALVAINTLFFSLTVGMCISALSRSARNAMGMTLLLILLITAGLPALGAWLGFVVRAKEVPVGFLMPSAGFTYFLAFDSSYIRSAKAFWVSLAVIHALGWLFLVLASLLAPRSWQDRPAGAQRLRWRERLRSWSYGDGPERAAFRRFLLNQNAYFWLAARARLKPAAVWAALALLGCCWAWGLAKFHRDWLSEFMYFATGVVLNLLIKTWFASETGRQLAADRTHGALELLLSTPLTVREILHGQLLALRRQFLGPVIVVLAVFFVFMLASASEVSASDDRAAWLMFWASLMILLVADLAGLYWVGMWQGLTARNPNRATGATLARIIVLPCIGFALASLVVSLLSLNHEPDLGPRFFLVLWVGLSLAADVGFGAWARHKLLAEFRLAATQRYTPGPGFWKRLLGVAEPSGTAAPPVIGMTKPVAPTVEST
jgi:hypothetical protein